MNDLKKIKLFLKSNCSFRPILLNLGNKGYVIEGELNYYNDRNVLILRDHINYLKDSLYLPQSIQDTLIRELPFIERDVYLTKVFNQNYDILIYTLNMDYTLSFYKNRKNNAKIGFGAYLSVFSSEGRKKLKIYLKKFKVNKKFLRFFKKNYQYIGQTTPSEFFDNLSFLKNHIKQPIIFINCPEIPKEGKYQFVNFEADHHREMNKVLEEFVKKNDDCYILDVREIITSEEYYQNNIRLYKPFIYDIISEELIKLL